MPIPSSNRDLIILAQRIISDQIAAQPNIEIGVLKTQNADQSWNVQLKSRDDHLYGVLYHGSSALMIGDHVTIGFYEGDRQRPFIMGPSGYLVGETITDYTYNRD